MKHLLGCFRLFPVRFFLSAAVFVLSSWLQAEETASMAKGATTSPATIRIKAGIKKGLTDSEGHAWLPDQGFTGGVIADRDVATTVANTKIPEIYLSERYNMTAFSYPVSNGKYVVKLHFSEMYERITGPGQRLFSLNVEGHEIKDLDLWVAAGGTRRAHVETVKVEVSDGKLDITFAKKKQFPVINGIEIIPGS